MLTPIVDKLCPRTAVRRIRNLPLKFFFTSKRDADRFIINSSMVVYISLWHVYIRTILGNLQWLKFLRIVRMYTCSIASVRHTHLSNCAVSKLVQQLRWKNTQVLYDCWYLRWVFLKGTEFARLPEFAPRVLEVSGHRRSRVYTRRSGCSQTRGGSRQASGFENVLPRCPG